MRGAKRSRRPGLLFEPAPHEVGVVTEITDQHIRLYQLDCRVTSQHAMTGPPHLSHSTLTQHRDELVASHFPRSGDLPAQPRYDMRDYDGHSHEHVIGIVHDEHVARGAEVPGPPGLRDQHSQRVHGYGYQSGY